MLMKRIISTLLAVLMLMGSLAVLVSAEDQTGTTETEKVEYTYNTTSDKPSRDYLKGTLLEIRDENEVLIQSADPVNTPEKKLATMDLRFEKEIGRAHV